MGLWFSIFCDENVDFVTFLIDVMAKQRSSLCF